MAAPSAGPRSAAADVESEREALLALGAQLAALVEAFDRVAADEQAMEAAAESFSSLLQARAGGPARHGFGSTAGA